MKSTFEGVGKFLYKNFARGLLLPNGEAGDTKTDADENSMDTTDQTADNNNAVVDWKDPEDEVQVGSRVVWLWPGHFSPASLPLAAGSYTGVVRWIGKIYDVDLVGVEFDQAVNMSSGIVENERLFHCKPDHGGFLFPNGLILEKYLNIKLPEFPDETILPPLGEADLIRIIDDRAQGIQGGNNSCYMDTTIFSMFAFTSLFDSLLIDQPWKGKPDIAEDLPVTAQRILREVIVNSLRKNVYCSEINMQKLRTVMIQFDTRFGADEMDPQEFIEILLRQVFHVEGFIKLSSGENDYLSQVLCNGNADFTPTVQQLFTESVAFQGLRFKEIPSPALLLQMPRSGSDYRMFPGILPSLSLDISDVLDGPSVKMDLFAVICISTNHFVTYVKCGKQRLSPWVLFNSMAKQDVANGEPYFVPMIWKLPKLGERLHELESRPDFLDKGIPEELRQIISDPYICFYGPGSSEEA